MRQLSSGDMLALVAELNARRIAMVCGKLAKRSGGHLILTPAETQNLQTARRLHHRYTLGDYRHEPSEAAQLRDLCQWLVDRHNDHLRGAGDSQPLEWNADKLVATELNHPPKGVYRKLVGAVLSGQMDGAAQT